MQDPSIEEPKEFRNIPRPLIGYVGSIHSSYIDTDFLLEIAGKRPNWSFVLIGPYKNNPLGPSLPVADLRKLKEMENIHLLGPRKFSEVPRYTKFFDVGMILLNHREFGDEFETRKRTNFKINLYFSQGKPLVSPSMEEYDKLLDLVYVADDGDSYINQIESALKEGPEKKNERVKYASCYDFERVLNLISEKILEYENEIEVAGW